MTEQDFEARLSRISSAIDALPEPRRAQLAEAVTETRKRFADLKGCVTRARDALDDLRLYQKYMLFEIEARMREAGGGASETGN